MSGRADSSCCAPRPGSVPLSSPAAPGHLKLSLGQAGIRDEQGAACGPTGPGAPAACLVQGSLWAWLWEGGPCLAQTRGADRVPLLGSLLAFGLLVPPREALGAGGAPRQTPSAHRSGHTSTIGTRQSSCPASHPGQPGLRGLRGPQCGQQGRGRASLRRRWGWGGGSQASKPVSKGAWLPRAHPGLQRGGGLALPLAEPGRLVGGAAPGPGGLSAGAAPGARASWHRGGARTEWPNPLGRASGPEPRALRFRLQSRPANRAGQGGEQAAARGHWAPEGSLPSPRPCRSLERAARGPRTPKGGWSGQGSPEQHREHGVARHRWVAWGQLTQVSGAQVGAGRGGSSRWPVGAGECGIRPRATPEGKSAARRDAVYLGREGS